MTVTRVTGLQSIANMVARLAGARGRRVIARGLRNSSRPEDLWFETERVIDTRHGPLRFLCMTEILEWRADWLLTKEPETIEWIDSFAAGDVFWDVGANAGTYTLYAGRRGIRTIAFEPGAGNYHALNRNIHANQLASVATAYCIALSGHTAIDVLNMQNTAAGTALSSFAVTTDETGKRFDPVFTQGMVGYTIDDFIKSFAPPFPNHLKLDVDGIELQILSGARDALHDSRLRSVSIEVEVDSADGPAPVDEPLVAAGFQITWTRQSPMIHDNSKYRQFYNRLYRRSP